MKPKPLAFRYRGHLSTLMAGTAVLATSPLAASTETFRATASPLLPPPESARAYPSHGLPILLETPAIEPRFAPAQPDTEVTLDLLDELLTNGERTIEVASADLAQLPASRAAVRSDLTINGTSLDWTAQEGDTEIVLGLTIEGGSFGEVVVSVATRDGLGVEGARADEHYEALDYCCLTITGDRAAEAIITLTGGNFGVHDVDRTFFVDVADAGDTGAQPYTAAVTIANSTPPPIVTITGGQFVEGSGIGTVYLAMIGETVLEPVVRNTAPFGTSMGDNDTAMGGGIDFQSRAGDSIYLLDDSPEFVGSCNDGPDNFCNGLTDAEDPSFLIGELCKEAGDSRCAVFRFDYELTDNDFVDGNKQFEAVFEAVRNVTLVNDSVMVVIVDDDGTTSQQTVPAGRGRYVFAFAGGTVFEIFFEDLDVGGLVSIERLTDFANPPEGIDPQNVFGEFLRITAPDLVGNDPVFLSWTPGDSNGLLLDEVNTAWRVVGGTVQEKLQATKPPSSSHVRLTISGASFSDWYAGNDDTNVRAWEFLE